MRLIIILSFLIALSILDSNAQAIENITTQIDGDKTYIIYDLVEVKENQQVDVKIFANVKGIDKPIFKVSGDLGKDIIPGQGRVIVWNNTEELTNYNLEDISFKVTVTAKQFYRAAKR